MRVMTCTALTQVIVCRPATPDLAGRHEKSFRTISGPGSGHQSKATAAAFKRRLAWDRL